MHIFKEINVFQALSRYFKLKKNYYKSNIVILYFQIVNSCLNLPYLHVIWKITDNMWKFSLVIQMQTPERGIHSRLERGSYKHSGVNWDP